MQKVNTLLELGRHREALSLLGSLGDEGMTPRAQCLRAQAYLGLRKYKEADNAAAAAIVAAPEWEWGYRLAAIAAMNQGRMRDADTLAERAVVVGPHEPYTHQVAALTAINRNDPRRALRHAESLVEMLPNESISHVTSAKALIAGGRPREAEAPLRRALAVDPQDDEAMSLLAQVVGKANPDEARQLRLSALQTAPHDPEHRRNMLKRGGVALGGAFFVLGKIGFFGKFAAIALFRHLPGGGTILLWLLCLGYPTAFAVTRYRRHRHGKLLPPRVWEGLRADRRNADLLWVAVPAAVVLVFGTFGTLGQLARDVPPWALAYQAAAAVLIVICWQNRLGDARELTPVDVLRRIGTSFRLMFRR